MARLPQSCIVTHESNGIDIITALILNDISPLCKYRMDLVLQLKVRRGLGWGGGDVSVSLCVPLQGHGVCHCRVTGCLVTVEGTQSSVGQGWVQERRIFGLIWLCRS